MMRFLLLYSLTDVIFWRRDPTVHWRRKLLPLLQHLRLPLWEEHPTITTTTQTGGLTTLSIYSYVPHTQTPTLCLQRANENRQCWPAGTSTWRHYFWLKHLDDTPLDVLSGPKISRGFICSWPTADGRGWSFDFVCWVSNAERWEFTVERRWSSNAFVRGFYRLLFVKQRDCPLPIQRLSIKTTVLCMATNTSVKSIVVTVGYNRASASEK